MYISLIVYLTTIAYLLKFNSQNKKNIRFFLILAFAFIGIMIGFRGISVGADTLQYYRSYLQFTNQPIGYRINSSDLEPGYILLMQLLNHISIDPQTMFIFEGLLVCITYAMFIYLNVKDLFEAYVAILGYLTFNIFSFQLTGYRQAIAMCICMIAYEFIKRKKIILFLVCVVFAAQFHASAWFFLPAYFVCITKSGKWKMIILGIVTLVIIANVGYFNTLIATVSERYSKYGVEDANNGYIFWIVVMLILVFAEIYKNKISMIVGNVSEIDVFYNINYIVCLLWTVRLFTRTAERPSFFYLPATMILVAKLANIKFLTVGEKNITKICLCGALILLFIYRYIRVPYSFIF